MFNSTTIILLLMAVAACIVLVYIRRHYKSLNVGSLSMITGGVKCGKSTLAVYVTLKEYRRAVRKVKIYNFFCRLFGRSSKQLEIPLLYSNIPLGVPYVPVTEDLLLRKTRFVYRSVIYINEASLVADSQLIKDMDLNTRLLLFNKLIGHETKGGKLIYDTQTVSDVHYTVKRSLSEYFYIHHLRKGLFFLTAYVIENRYSEDGSVVTVSQDDLEESGQLKKVLLSKKTWKYFDCYCFSVLTDELPVERNIVKAAPTLKAEKIVSFRPMINKMINKEEKNEKV